jgi:hypothetical protein
MNLANTITEVEQPVGNRQEGGPRVIARTTKSGFMSSSTTSPDLPPSAVMMQMLVGKYVAQAISVAAELGIADLLRDGERSTADLAAASVAHEPSLYRLLRALASVGVFTETGPRHFAMTPLAECLRSDGPDSLRALARAWAMPLTWDAWREFSHSVRTGEPAVRKLGIDNPFEYLKDHPSEGAIFNDAMTQFSRQSAGAVADAYDFSRFHRLVDIAGGHGYLLATVLDRNPHLNGVLFDLPEVIASAPAGRYQTVTGNFFESVPEGADAYMMKHIIHDWNDERCATILHNCHRAMAAEGRLLIVEMVIPPGNDQFFGKWIDLEMLAIPGGKERTGDEFRTLFASAGFELTEIIDTTAPVSIVEGRPIR